MEKGAILVGEPMGLFIAQEEGELSDVSGYSMAVAGAEFNVAVGLARLNLPVTYLTVWGKTLLVRKLCARCSAMELAASLSAFPKNVPQALC